MSRAHHSNSGEPSQRMLRVAELIRHSVAESLARGDVLDPVLETHVVTVPRVRMSPDLKLATIFVMPLGGVDSTEVIAALERNKKFLRGEVVRKVNLKFAPDIRFRLDESFENAAKIDALLNSPKVRGDLDENS
jgi:ribosome-binding factor A